jgi:hypothetical protein
MKDRLLPLKQTIHHPQKRLLNRRQQERIGRGTPELSELVEEQHAVVGKCAGIYTAECSRMYPERDD